MKFSLCEPKAIWNDVWKAYKDRYTTKMEWNFLLKLRKRFQRKKESFQWMSNEMILKHVWMWILISCGLSLFLPWVYLLNLHASDENVSKVLKVLWMYV